MADLPLTAAFAAYDRTNPLRTGDVRPEGVDLRVLTYSTTEIFYRMVRYREFDASEMSMAAHTYLTGTGENPFVGIPAFPSRAFRHNTVYLNAEAGIEKPQDLNGKRIGVYQWGITALVWIVGVLAEEHGLDIASVDWVAETESRVPLRMPGGARLRHTEKGETVEDMLERGELDAAFLLHIPECFARTPARVTRLFPDYKNTELEYFRRTGIHPMMHCVVLQKNIYERNPWVLHSLYKALCDARRLALEDIGETGHLSAILPTLPAAVEEARRIFGDDLWPYGMEGNRKALEKFLQYAHLQGLTSRILAVEDIFGESVQDESFI